MGVGVVWETQGGPASALNLSLHTQPLHQPQWTPNKMWLQGIGASLVAQLVKNLPAMGETWIWSLGWEDPMEKGIATHSNILAWKIPWTYSMGSQRVGHDWVPFTFTSTSRELIFFFFFCLVILFFFANSLFLWFFFPPGKTWSTLIPDFQFFVLLTGASFRMFSFSSVKSLVCSRCSTHIGWNIGLPRMVRTMQKHLMFSVLNGSSFESHQPY